MLGRFSISEIIIVLVVLIALFGSKKIVDLARGAGEATRDITAIKKDYKKTVENITTQPDSEI